MIIEEFITYMENLKLDNPTRGFIIDQLAGHEDNWILILKALLIKNPNKYISKYYVLQKLKFMKRNPDKPNIFLDFQGLNIFRALKGL